MQGTTAGWAAPRGGAYHFWGADGRPACSPEDTARYMGEKTQAAEITITTVCPTCLARVIDACAVLGVPLDYT